MLIELQRTCFCSTHKSSSLGSMCSLVNRSQLLKLKLLLTASSLSAIFSSGSNLGRSCPTVNLVLGWSSQPKLVLWLQSRRSAKTFSKSEMNVSSTFLNPGNFKLQKSRKFISSMYKEKAHFSPSSIFGICIRSLGIFTNYQN